MFDAFVGEQQVGDLGFRRGFFGDHGQVAFRYASGTNPNGSVNDIAGIVSQQGNVLGMKTGAFVEGELPYVLDAMLAYEDSLLVTE